MRVTRKQLKRIIKEEARRLNEQDRSQTGMDIDKVKSISKMVSDIAREVVENQAWWDNNHPDQSSRPPGPNRDVKDLKRRLGFNQDDSESGDYLQLLMSLVREVEGL